MAKSILYLISALATLFYALPRLPLYHASFNALVFSGIWLFFALLILGAHLDRLLILDEEKRKSLARIKKFQIWKKEQQIMQSQKKKLSRIQQAQR